MARRLGPKGPIDEEMRLPMGRAVLKSHRFSHPKNVSYPGVRVPIGIGEGGPTPTIRSQM